MAEAKKYLLIGRKNGEEQQVHAKGGHQKDVKKAYLEGGGYEVTVTEVTEEPGAKKEEETKEVGVRPVVGASIFIIVLGIIVAFFIGASKLVVDIGESIFNAWGPGGVLLVLFILFVAGLFLYAFIYFATNKVKVKK